MKCWVSFRFPIAIFVLYQACMINYSGNQARRALINPNVYTAEEKQADCSAIIHLRDEKKSPKQDLELAVRILGIQDLDDPMHQPPTPKDVRRGEVMTECYNHDGTELSPNP